jgi:hypothetical protein
MAPSNWIIGTAFVGLLAAAGQGEAQAATSTVPGNTCQGQLNHSRPTGPAIEANTGSDLIYCGLTRTNATGTLGASYARIYNPGGNLTCYLYAFDSLGSTFDFDSASTLSTGSQSLFLDGASMTTYSYGYYYAFCNVPQYAKIWGIRYLEP